MALQSSGSISISQIMQEVGSSSGSLRALSSASGFFTPDAMSEFYGYAKLQDVYIRYYAQNYMNCYNFATFGAAASDYINLINVQTTLNITMNWYGDLGGFLQANFSISAGNSCNTTSVYTGGSINCAGENVSGMMVSFTCPSCTGVGPFSTPSYGTQIYRETYTTQYGFYPC